MRSSHWLTFLVALLASSPLNGATQDNTRPDKEMLRMLDFLREMELIKHAEMMQDLSHVEQVGDHEPSTSVQKMPPAKKKEAPK